MVQATAGELDNEGTAAQLALGRMIELAMSATPGPQVSIEGMGCRAVPGRSVRAAGDKAMELGGGASFFCAGAPRRPVRDAQGVRFHPLQDKPQVALAGRFALGLPFDQPR